MQVKFETDYLYLLFADSFFQDNQFVFWIDGYRVKTRIITWRQI